MAFESYKLKQLKKELQKEKENAAKKESLLKKQLNKELLLRDKKIKIQAAKNKLLNEQKILQRKIQKAKQIKLTPAQQKLLLEKKKNLEKKRKILIGTAKGVGMIVGDLAMAPLKFLGSLEFVDETDKSRRKKRTKKRK